MAAIKRKGRKITEEYFTEKIEAYNVAIEALRSHEPMSDGNQELASKLRTELADKLDQEIQQWVEYVRKA
jgi:hypothetical protein